MIILAVEAAPQQELANVRVAQSAERPAFNRVVAGSIPATGDIMFNPCLGSLFASFGNAIYVLPK